MAEKLVDGWKKVMVFNGPYYEGNEQSVIMKGGTTDQPLLGRGILGGVEILSREELTNLFTILTEHPEGESFELAEDISIETTDGDETGLFIATGESREAVSEEMDEDDVVKLLALVTNVLEKDKVAPYLN